MPIVIKKKVSLDFLGDEYKDSYLILRSISIGDYEKLGDITVKDCVIGRFIDGEIQQESGKVKLTKETLNELPGEVFVEAFAAITGQLNPKVWGQSKTQSSTNNPAPRELELFYYRQTFGLSALELEQEPIDQFFTNIFILGQIAEKNRINNKHA
jgi:hypothetical protein